MRKVVFFFPIALQHGWPSNEGRFVFPALQKKKKKEDLMGKMKVISFNYKTNKHENGSDDRRDFQKKYRFFSFVMCSFVPSLLLPSHSAFYFWFESFWFILDILKAWKVVPTKKIFYSPSTSAAICLNPTSAFPVAGDSFCFFSFPMCMLFCCLLCFVFFVCSIKHFPFSFAGQVSLCNVLLHRM